MAAFTETTYINPVESLQLMCIYQPYGIHSLSDSDRDTKHTHTSVSFIRHMQHSYGTNIRQILLQFNSPPTKSSITAVSVSLLSLTQPLTTHSTSHQMDGNLKRAPPVGGYQLIQCDLHFVSVLFAQVTHCTLQLQKVCQHFIKVLCLMCAVLLMIQVSVL